MELSNQDNSGVSNGDWPDWKRLLENSVVSATQLSEHYDIDSQEINAVLEKYPMKINPYYRSLIKSKHDPFWKQSVPDIKELDCSINCSDPLSEESQSPVKSIIHRYPDRVIFLVSNKCAMYCRHCMRKRKVGEGALHFDPQGNSIGQGLDYINHHTQIRDVILSGGDPLLLETNDLDYILTEIRNIPHVDMVRIHSRIPCTLPFRVTDNLVTMLKKHHPLYLNTHFNHPDEITPEAKKACSMLADAGIPLGCQTVLLKGVNDSPDIMAELMRKLLKIRVKPYYLHHPDPVEGTAHFRPPLETGLTIMKQLQGHLSGHCVPHYMVDLPGGHGKAPVFPETIKFISNEKMCIENYEGRICDYVF